jgi:hypothetical protein
MTDDDDRGGSQQQFGVGNDEVLGRASPVRRQITLLLSEKRYEEALELLYATRWEAPDSAEISRGINLLKERLIRHYLEELGNLDAVPQVVAELDPARLDIGEEERTLLRLVDGISSFSDIAHQSRLGRFETYRALTRFVGEGLVVVAAPPIPAELPRQRRSTTFRGIPLAPSAPPRHRSGPLVGLGMLALVGTIGAGWWAFDRFARPLRHVLPVASIPATQPPATEPQDPPAEESNVPVIPTPEPLPEKPELAANEVSAAATSGFAAPADSVPKGRPTRRSKGRSSSRSAAAATAEAPALSPVPGGGPAPVPGPAPGPAPVAEERRVAPSLPELRADADPPPLLALSAPARGGTVSDRSRYARVAPAQSPGKPASGAGTPAMAPFTPAAVSVTTNSLVVRGPLGRSVVEHAIDRVAGSFGACYSTAASTSRRNAAGTARVMLTIDETGNADAVSVSGAPLPGLDGCLQEAARRIRTRVPPDVGLATVAFTVGFSVGGPAR